ncbi:NfeD family protein [Chloroflexota bacterium]
MKRTIKDWLKVLVLLLDEAAAAVLIILVLQVLGIKIPLPITIIVILVLGVLIFIIHRAVIPTFYKKQVTGAEAMAGIEAEVIEPLTPKGLVRVKGEYWKARSIDEDIEVGEVVEILDLDGLTLKVRRKEK